MTDQPTDQPTEPAFGLDRDAPDYVADRDRVRDQLIAVVASFNRHGVTTLTTAEHLGRILAAVTPPDRRSQAVVADAVVRALGNVNGIFGPWPYVPGSLEAYATGRDLGR